MLKSNNIYLCLINTYSQQENVCLVLFEKILFRFEKFLFSLYYLRINNAEAYNIYSWNHKIIFNFILITNKIKLSKNLFY